MPRTHKRSSKARRQRRPHDRILSFEAKGGFLDGARLDFVPGLNCIIGARGAGKTTVIELVRHILGLMPDPTISPARAKDLAKLIEANLGASGTAAVKVETKQGAGYAVQRSSHDVASVQDEQGAATAVRLVQDLIFQVEVYGKNEIEEIATTPALQLALLDKHADPDMRRVASEIRSVLRSLEENAHELLGLERATQELGDTTAEAVAIEVKLKEFQESGGADATKINAAHAEKALREKERRTTDSLGSVYRQIAADLESRALAYARRLEV
ncbi:AAA family ATPase, partial [bacterium]|nr:AAA family ATPase [bacterium]